MATVLQLDKTTIRFGGLTAVSALDLAIGANELMGLIGPNGAGKTTVFNLITGVYQPTEGQILFQVGRHHGTTSRRGVLHERGDLHELDGGAHTIETRHALKQLISKERFGSVF